MTTQTKSAITTPKHVHQVSSTSMERKSVPLSGELRYKAPTVFYTQEVKLMMDHIIDKAVGEVGWLGLVEEYENAYVIREIFVPEQTVTAATTEIEPEALLELTMQLLNEGKDPSMLRYWGHSHVNMQVRPSGRDEAQIEEYLDTCEWFIRGIYNKKGDSKVDVYDTEGDVIHQCVPNQLLPVKLPDVKLEELNATLTKNVKAPVRVFTNAYSYPNYYRGAQTSGKPNPVSANVAGGGKEGTTKLHWSRQNLDTAMADQNDIADQDDTQDMFLSHMLGGPLSANEQMEICAYYEMAYDADRIFTTDQIIDFRMHDPFNVGG